MEALFFVFLMSSADLLFSRQKTQILFTVWAGKCWWSEKPEPEGVANHQPSALNGLAPFVGPCVVVIVAFLGRKSIGDRKEVGIF